MILSLSDLILQIHLTFEIRSATNFSLPVLIFLNHFNDRGNKI